jgi:acetyl esterase/lipase
MNYLFFSLLFFWINAKDGAFPPAQPAEGPGSYVYAHQDMAFLDMAQEEDGYWLFEPAAPKPKEAPVVVFLHGYGAYNPMVYGHWIRHLVRKGNIVIFPRYQKNLLSPFPKEFADNTAKAIKDAYTLLQTDEHVRPNEAPLVMVGHSYGGVIAAKLGVAYKDFGIPQPKGIFLCAPGSGPLKGGRLETYEAMPADTKLLIMVSNGDHVVGDEFAKLVFETATNTPQRNFIRHFTDDYGFPEIRTHHNTPYSVDLNLDVGLHSLTTWRARRTSRVDATDYFGFWKLMDGLIACTREGEYCNYAFGDTPEQRYLGEWSDGTPVRELKVMTPEQMMVKDDAKGDDVTYADY